MLRTARGSRAMLAFLLTLAVTFSIGEAVGVPVTAFLIAFPVTVFCCAAISDDETRARIGKIAALSASAGAMFTLSALLHTSWVNHLVFVLVIGVAAYMRQYGGPWVPAGLAANVSYFFGAFLKPDIQMLHWQWIGVAVGAACALLVHQLVVPHRPWRRMQWSVGSIRMRMGALLAAAASPGGRNDGARLKRDLARVASAVTIAEAELENLPGGRLAHRPLAEALIAVLVLAERLALQVQDAPDGLGASDVRAALERLSRALICYTPVPHEGDVASIAAAIEDLERSLRLPPDMDAAKSMAAPPTDRKRPHLRSGIQSAAAAALAMVGGSMLSPDRWYWAVITVFVMFTGTYSRGQALAKSLKRVFGTLAGILAAMALVWLLHGKVHIALALMPLAIFFVFYAFVQSYTWMAFWITVTVGLLFLVMGRFTDTMMLLRLEETAVGALAGIIVAAIVLPKSTHTHAPEQFNDLLDATHAVIITALPRARLDRLHLTATLHDFEAKLSSLREAVEPLRFFPLARANDQRDRITRELVLLSYWVHEIALAVRQLDSAGIEQPPPQALQAAAATEKVIGRLRAPGYDETTTAEDDRPRSIPSDTVDPLKTISIACEGAGRALVNITRLITNRTVQSRAFRF
ncbi:FUSC family protein [Altererythrobacter sp. B11]|uniref:FUSC family protein n=1 Tax=Altererythrobacter sp. B11 TaxID=2060312 RepID=UPI00155922AB|nr:FUSC family protein [Altererythrobacter sp. B11]